MMGTVSVNIPKALATETLRGWPRTIMIGTLLRGVEAICAERAAGETKANAERIKTRTRPVDEAAQRITRMFSNLTANGRAPSAGLDEIARHKRESSGQE